LGACCATNRRRSGRRESRSGDYVSAATSRIAPLVLRVGYRPGYPLEPLSSLVDRGALAIETVARHGRAGIFQVAANTDRSASNKTCVQPGMNCWSRAE